MGTTNEDSIDGAPLLHPGAATQPIRHAYLPTAIDEVDLDEARRIVAEFEVVRRRARGRHAAPDSWLPAAGDRVATALSRVAAEATEWSDIRTCREAFVDLQAFVADEDAARVESSIAGSDAPASRQRPGDEVLERIRWAQAQAISLLREDDQVLGAANGLANVDIVIGGARRSLDAVDRYKEAQALGIASILVWPACLGFGLAAGSILARPTTTAIVIVGGLVLAGWFLALGPAWGSLVGSLASRVDRRVMRQDDAARVARGRTIASVLMIALYVSVPFGIALAITLAAAATGLP